MRVHIDILMHVFRSIELCGPNKMLKNSLSSSLWDQHRLLTTTLHENTLFSSDDVFGQIITFFH